MVQERILPLHRLVSRTHADLFLKLTNQMAEEVPTESVIPSDPNAIFITYAALTIMAVLPIFLGSRHSSKGLNALFFVVFMW